MKTGLATFTPIKEDEDSGVSKYFAVTRVIKGGNRYYQTRKRSLTGKGVVYTFTKINIRSAYQY